MSSPLPLVLVFDREASTRAWYRAAFAPTNYRITEAADGSEAVEQMTAQLPDLIIAELRPQYRDGLTLSIIKRANAATADIPILLMIVDDDPDVEAAGRLVGAAALLVKPPSTAAVTAVGHQLILTTPKALVTRRRLYRTLADLRKDVRAHPPEPAAVELQARRLLAHVGFTLSSIVLTNDEARCMAVNAAACQLTGYSESELLARSVWDLAPLDASDQARMLWGRFLVNGECAGEFLMVQKDGETVPIQLCAQTNIAPGLHATIVDGGSIDE